MSVLAPDDMLTREGDPLSCTLGADEVILLSTERAMYYALDATASHIWNLLDTPTTFGDLCARLTTEFDVSVEQCRVDVASCLRPLIDDALIHVAVPSP